MQSPRLFISYSWTSPDHEAWVLGFATDLRQSGVDVILDKWDLKEGHDAHAFMEKMVSDPAIEKVALICDRTYAEKADQRSGGVGAESQIISSSLYNDTDQGKFVAIVRDRDEEGKPCVPVYYKSRVYIDLSDASAYSESFDQLLRWVFDKPLHVKPEIGEALDIAALPGLRIVRPRICSFGLKIPCGLIQAHLDGNAQEKPVPRRLGHAGLIKIGLLRNVPRVAVQQ